MKQDLHFGIGLNLSGFEKGRKGYPIGTIREYNGVKFVKVSADKWSPVKKGSADGNGIKEDLIPIVWRMEKEGWSGKFLNWVGFSKRNLLNFLGIDTERIILLDSVKNRFILR